jgi:methionyl-tRNA synthetase
MVLGQDASFTLDAFTDRYNADLSNDYGNLVNRIFILINKNFNNCIPEKGDYDSIDLGLIADIKKLQSIVIKNYNTLKIHDAVEENMRIFRKVNKYLENKAPWKMIKENKSQAATTIYIAAETLRIGTILLYPIIPDKSQQVLNSINSTPKDSTSFGELVENSKIEIIKNIFPRFLIKCNL